MVRNEKWVALKSSETEVFYNITCCYIINGLKRYCMTDLEVLTLFGVIECGLHSGKWTPEGYNYVSTE